MTQTLRYYSVHTLGNSCQILRPIELSNSMTEPVTFTLGMYVCGGTFAAMASFSLAGVLCAAYDFARLIGSLDV